MSKPVNTGRKKPPTHPRVPGSKMDAKVVRTYDDSFISNGRYKFHLRGRRVGPLPTLNDYEGSKM